MIKLPLRTARFNSPLSDDNVRISCWFSSHRVLTCLFTPLWTLQGSCKPSWGSFFECVCSSHLSPNCCCLNIISLSSSRTESMLSYGSMEENKFIMQDFFSSRAKWVFVYPYTIQLPHPRVNNCGLLNDHCFDNFNFNQDTWDTGHSLPVCSIVLVIHAFN